MNFWKILRKLLDEISPDSDWQNKFISYKDLKHQLKLIYSLSDDHVGEDETERPTKRLRLDEKTDFLKLLEEEIKKFNDFFMDKEEECMIKLKWLKAEVYEENVSRQELMRLGKKVVNIHGEMILLKNYSGLNYIGLLKILKKYDKRSGDLSRLAFIKKVLQEPFVKTEVITNLVKDCDTMIHFIFSRHDQQSAPAQQDSENTTDNLNVEEEFNVEEEPGVTSALGELENEYMKLSRSALQALRRIRNGSSTIDMFSLPRMD